MASWNYYWDIPGMKAGVITGDTAWNLYRLAKARKFALPAINCVTSSSVNAVLEGAAKIGRPIVIQFSYGGAEFFCGKGLGNKDQSGSILGAVAGAHYVRNVSPAYGVPILVHSDHCAKKLLPWFDGMLEADQEYFKVYGEPLFSSHMLDLSEEPHEENVGICADYFKKMSPLNLILEMEIGITGGVEDGVNNEGVSKDKLYTTKEDIKLVWDKLSPISEKFQIAAAFGNVHGVYKPGNVVLRPELLDEFQKDHGARMGYPKPYFFVFHGGSGSTKKEIDDAVSYGVVKMNIDTDTQWAYWEGLLKFYQAKSGYLQGQIGNPDGQDKPNKSYYDPRKWVRESEVTMRDRAIVACTDLSNTKELVMKNQLDLAVLNMKK
jgi:fructose-bisphosphate aldolase class II